jgi:hypothetical protein
LNIFTTLTCFQLQFCHLFMWKFNLISFPISFIDHMYEYNIATAHACMLMLISIGRWTVSTWVNISRWSLVSYTNKWCQFMSLHEMFILFIFLFSFHFFVSERKTSILYYLSMCFTKKAPHLIFKQFRIATCVPKF